jgi:hypothetical protein
MGPREEVERYRRAFGVKDTVPQPVLV